MTYVHTLKRIREDKTNYRKRSAILIGRHLFVTVRISDQNVAAQVLKPTPTGDIVIASAHSRELAEHGWKGTFNNLPACYLTGMLLGKKAIQKEIDAAVLYIGKNHFTSRVGACMKGIVDAGVSMPVSEESLPDEDRISGQHIAEYSHTLKEDEKEYNSRFSAILKNGLKPEDYPSHFEEIKSKISGEPAEKAMPEKAAKKATAKEGRAKEKKKNSTAEKRSQRREE
ncbi:MAG TPA: 50S ribosomal protein L18 [Nitrososphaera sp.]|nr:50S ribosomal protein L18 [Nitrososphaera sp.]